VSEAASDGVAQTAQAEVPWDVESDSFADSPEVFIGAAFVGGLLLAQILRRINA
jgi:hypothetical protein